MSRIPRSLPVLVADPGAVRDVATRLLVVAAVLDDTHGVADGEGRLPDWSGVAADSYRAGLPLLARRAQARSLALREVARAVDAHAEALELLGRRREQLAEVRAVLVRDAVRAPELGLEERVAGFDAEVAAWEGEVVAAETAMVRVFTRSADVARADRRFADLQDPADGLVDLLPADADADDVARWWASLTVQERQALAVTDPDLIGRLDGLDAATRHGANTVALDRDLGLLGLLDDLGVLRDDERDELAIAESAQRALEADDVAEPPRQLYLYDPDAFEGDGAVAVSVGDLDTADDVAVVVPGFGTDATSIDSQADRAAALEAAADGDDAVLAWIGYDAPDDLPWQERDGDGLGVLDEKLASDGGRHLADLVDGLRAARDDDPAHVTAIGYSYGSTTTGHAAHDHGLDVDDLVFVGSPGVGADTQHAADTGVDSGHVWAGANSRDPVTLLGDHGWVGPGAIVGAGLGHDPADAEFGATRFGAESADPPTVPDLAQHGGYFDPGSESLSNLAAVVDADYDAVDVVEPRHDPWYGPPVDPEAA